MALKCGTRKLLKYNLTKIKYNNNLKNNGNKILITS